jgi:hypothetical protein
LNRLVGTVRVTKDYGEAFVHDGIEPARYVAIQA